MYQVEHTTLNILFCGIIGKYYPIHGPELQLVSTGLFIPATQIIDPTPQTNMMGMMKITYCMNKEGKTCNNLVELTLWIPTEQREMPLQVNQYLTYPSIKWFFLFSS